MVFYPKQRAFIIKHYYAFADLCDCVCKVYVIEFSNSTVPSNTAMRRIIRKFKHEYTLDHLLCLGWLNVCTLELVQCLKAQIIWHHVLKFSIPQSTTYYDYVLSAIYIRFQSYRNINCQIIKNVSNSVAAYYIQSQSFDMVWQFFLLG